jgi:hypothetical protein
MGSRLGEGDPDPVERLSTCHGWANTVLMRGKMGLY